MVMLMSDDIALDTPYDEWPEEDKQELNTHIQMLDAAREGLSHIIDAHATVKHENKTVEEAEAAIDKAFDEMPDEQEEALDELL